MQCFTEELTTTSIYKLGPRWWLQPLRKKKCQNIPRVLGWNQQKQVANQNPLDHSAIFGWPPCPNLPWKARLKRKLHSATKPQHFHDAFTFVSCGLSLCVKRPPIFLVQTPQCPSHVGSFRPIWLGTKEDLATLSMTRKVRLPKAQQIHGESPAV